MTRFFSRIALLLTLSLVAFAGTNQTTSKTLTLNGVSQLSITTTSLPSFFVGTPYSATLAATGGTAPYSWSITSGTLPNGLALNPSTGVISGTATALCAVNPCSLTITVTDNSSSVAQIKLQWNQSPTPGVQANSVYRGTKSGGPYTAIAKNLPATTTFTDNSTAHGTSLFYVVTAIANGLESAKSSEAVAVIP
jgi:hypothetical protein